MTPPATLAPPAADLPAADPPAENPPAADRSAGTITGTVRGGEVVLDDASALPDGTRVSVTPEPTAPEMPVPEPPVKPGAPTPGAPNEAAAAMAAAFGAWAEDAAELDDFLKETDRLRRSPRDHWLPDD